MKDFPMHSANPKYDEWNAFVCKKHAVTFVNLIRTTCMTSVVTGATYLQTKGSVHLRISKYASRA